VVVDATGNAVDIGILEPLGMGLDEQAVLALKQWKFRPSILNGQPVPVRIKC
jgi:TonB family protein